MSEDLVLEILNQYSEALNWNYEACWAKLYNSISTVDTHLDESLSFGCLVAVNLCYRNKKSFEFKLTRLLLTLTLSADKNKILIELLLQIGFKKSALLVLFLNARPKRDFRELIILILSFNKTTKYLVTHIGSCFYLNETCGKPNSNPRKNSQTVLKIWGTDDGEVVLPDSFANFEFMKQEFRNCKVTGTGLIIKNRTLFLLDRGANPTKGFVSGTWPYLSGSNLNTSICFLNNLQNINLEISNGYDLLGRNSANYFHSLIEYLPKILYNDDSNATLIINREYPNAIKHAIDLLNNRNCSIKEIDRNHIVNLRKLTSQSLPTAFYDSLAIPHTKSMSFNSEALKSIRNLLLKSVGKPRFASKLILDRGANTARSARNFETLIFKLQDSSFQLIKMHELDLLDQINAFYFADTIVGVGGAHFANLIFSKPGQKVFCITSEGPASWPGFQQLSTIFDLDYNGIVGSLENSGFDSALDKYHGNFIVPEDSYTFIMDSK